MQQIQTDREQDVQAEEKRLVSHVRRLRLRYRTGLLSQADLAQIVGLSPRQVRLYERCRTLPAALDAFLSLAIALEVSIDELVEPRVIAERVCAVEERRRAHDDSGTAHS